jgi:hypothetical protein
MSCENYRAALIEAAVNGAVPSIELGSHLKACEACNTALVAELRLLTSIDAALTATANSEVPASLLPRVRAELQNRTTSNQSWVLNWTAVMVASVLILTVVFVRGVIYVNIPSKLESHSVVRVVTPAGVEPSSVGAPVDILAGLMKNRPNHSRRITSHPAWHLGKVPVLVPSGQRRAMDALLVRLRQGSADSHELVAAESEKLQEDLQVAPLTISPIELKPIADMSEDSRLKNETTNR